jgi:hypothetical protein
MVRVDDKELANEIFELIRNCFKIRFVKVNLTLFYQFEKLKLLRVEKGVFTTAHVVEDDT